MCERLFDLLEWGFSEFETLGVQIYRTGGMKIDQQPSRQIKLGKDIVMDKHMKFEMIESQFLVGHQISVFELKERLSLLFETRSMGYRSFDEWMQKFLSFRSMEKLR